MGTIYTLLNKPEKAIAYYNTIIPWYHYILNFIIAGIFKLYNSKHMSKAISPKI